MSMLASAPPSIVHEQLAYIANTLQDIATALEKGRLEPRQVSDSLLRGIGRELRSYRVYVDKYCEFDTGFMCKLLRDTLTAVQQAILSSNKLVDLIASRLYDALEKGDWRRVEDYAGFLFGGVAQPILSEISTRVSDEVRRVATTPDALLSEIVKLKSLAEKLKKLEKMTPDVNAAGVVEQVASQLLDKATSLEAQLIQQASQAYTSTLQTLADLTAAAAKIEVEAPPSICTSGSTESSSSNVLGGVSSGNTGVANSAGLP